MLPGPVLGAARCSFRRSTLLEQATVQALRLRLVDHDGSSTRAPISSVAPSHAPRSTQSGRGRGPFARHRAHAQVASSELQFFEFFGQVKMCNLFNLPQVHVPHVTRVHVQLYTDACFIACFMPILFETMEKLFEIMFFFRGVPVLHSPAH